MERRTFKTLRGREVVMWCRPGTNDRMVSESVIEADEYKSFDLRVGGGCVIDVGAHIGAWVCMMLVDWQLARAIAVEPLPANIEMLTRNLAANGLSDRVEVVQAALSKGRAKVPISWGFAGSAIAEMHRFIGSQRMSDDTEYQVEMAPPVSVPKLLKMAGDTAAMKIDCEGGEKALMGADLSSVDVITGEYHFEPKALVAHLEKTHEVKTEGGPGLGAFVAKRK